MEWKRWKIDNKNLKNIFKITIFTLITSIPFINITAEIGMETFLDSFENSDSYIFLKNNYDFSATDTTKPSYIIIQRINHPDFEIKIEDKIMHSTLSGDIVLNKIIDIKTIGDYKSFRVENNENKGQDTLYEYQIIGKVIKIVDENPLNEISLRLWGTAIENLNINSILK